MLRGIYRVFRSIIFTGALVTVGLYVVLYILLSLPVFTGMVKDRIAEELSHYTGGTILIDELDIYPFNEVKISGLEVLDPSGEQCLSVETIGAGIRLWKLILDQDIELTFGEIIGLHADIVQQEKEGPLNIQFLIDAFSSKEENKEPKPFSVSLKNVVLRKSSANFRRPWLNSKIGEINQGDLRVTDLAADISLPKLSDQGVEVDLRRLSLTLPGLTRIEKLALKGELNKDSIDIKNFILETPASRIHIPELQLTLGRDGDFMQSLKEDIHEIKITESYLTPSDFAFLVPGLSSFTERLDLEVDISGNLSGVDLRRFYIGNPDLLLINLQGQSKGLEDIKKAEIEVEDIHVYAGGQLFSHLDNFLTSIPEDLSHAVRQLGEFELKGEARGDFSNNSAEGHIEITTNAFELSAEGKMSQPNASTLIASGEVTVSDLRIQQLFPKVPVGNLNLNVVGDMKIQGKDSEGTVSLAIDDFEYKGKYYEGLSLNISKEGDIIEGDLLIDNAIAELEAKFGGDIGEGEKSARLDMDLRSLNLSEVVDMKTYEGYKIEGSINFDGKGSGLNDLTGELNLHNFTFSSSDNSRRLRMRQMHITAESVDSIRIINLDSDWVSLRADGPYRLKDLPGQLTRLAHSVFPAIVPYKEAPENAVLSDMEFDVVIKKNNSVAEFFNLPIRLLVPVTLSGTISGSEDRASLTLDAPYLQQGKDKLIYDTKLVLDIDGGTGILGGLIETNVPVKRGDLSLNVNFFGKDNKLDTDIHFINTENSDYRGRIDLETKASKNNFTREPEITLAIQPSMLHMGAAEWNMANALISYSDKTVTIEGLKIWHDNQFVEIDGKASAEYADAVNIRLADIDVDYVFEMLAINYVTFGGTATGEITGHALLSGDPVAETESLIIKDFTYNGCPIGVCEASSRWNNEEKEIEIQADITEGGVRRVFGKGGIWLGRDSLCFDLAANRVPVDFVQPFMAVFSSHVGGYATGDVKLYGNFHDIDMTGKIFADSVAVKLDYTNTIYHGSDSVILTPGRIDIPHFRLYDKYDNSAMLTGELTHRYFHDPSFTFRLSDADNFLCYDTNSDINPDWYGTLYGSGSALLQGVPGITDISADMTVSGNSVFTFVLNETQYAQDYQFLTFSDRRAEAKKEESPLTTEDIKAMLKKQMADNSAPSGFSIDIRASVTPQVLFTLVMDPAAGDKITARGQGAMQVKYESDNDEMMMYGKYEIAEGNYNFSLQDIILRDFKIREGSYISFNGNPLAADLDITATYRVNTNLSDLDKSFSTDRDLNRTNVPVDAVLMVDGNMEQPDITFDIELPTLTQDVERKVKSIISTDDMMNRQIIYLLALNRFYTPEYMGMSGNGGELAAVASSTISSQLSNILGQLTDKFSVSPSFRSDKGDFSDIEVDVALSSRLLNNRLLINGNFGYRDRSTSTTTFVGDFDVEYLLSKNGNLRLKAYNHFNDQNYYLREALTTQGLGVVYRKDFDDGFKFLKSKKKETKKEDKK